MSKSKDMMALVWLCVLIVALLIVLPNAINRESFLFFQRGCGILFMGGAVITFVLLLINAFRGEQ